MQGLEVPKTSDGGVSEEKSWSAVRSWSTCIHFSTSTKSRRCRMGAEFVSCVLKKRREDILSVRPRSSRRRCAVAARRTAACFCSSRDAADPEQA